MFNTQPLASIKPPPPDNPYTSAAFDMVKQFWEQGALPAIDNMYQQYSSGTHKKIDALDLYFRDREARIQVLADRFDQTATELQRYLLSSEQTIGQLRASDQKQDKSIEDIWREQNAISDRLKSVERSLSIVELAQAGLRTDIYGESASNTPGLAGTIREMKTEIMAELSNIKAQYAVDNRELQQHRQMLEKLTRRKGVFVRFRIWVFGE